MREEMSRPSVGIENQVDDSLLEDADGRDNDNVVSAQEQTRETDPECCFDSAVEVTAVVPLASSVCSRS